MTAKILCVVTLVVGLAIDSRAHEATEVERALTALGTGSLHAIKDRIFNHPILVNDEEGRAQAVTTLRSSIRREEIATGKLQRRVAAIFRRVMEAQERSPEGVKLFLFRDEVPRAMLWRGCVLAISDGLADALMEGELAGIIAHELGHSFFMDDLVLAQRSKDSSTMRIIELKCDAVAILSLKLMEHDPKLFLKALKTLKEIWRRRGLSTGIYESHPDPVQRAQLSERVLKLIA